MKHKNIKRFVSGDYPEKERYLMDYLNGAKLTQRDISRML